MTFGKFAMRSKYNMYIYRTGGCISLCIWCAETSKNLNYKFCLKLRYIEIIHKLSRFFFVLHQVSWIRQRDLHILTVGILTYTNDQRFQSLHSDGSDEWTLKISSPQTRDTGTYECQVSTEPKISQEYKLNVVGEFLFLSTLYLNIFILKKFIFSIF